MLLSNPSCKKVCCPQESYDEKGCEIKGGGQELAVMVGNGKHFRFALHLAPNSPELLILKFSPLTLATTSDFTFFHHAWGHTLYLQLGCFGLDFTNCMLQSRPIPSFGGLFLLNLLVFYRQKCGDG